MAWQDDYYVGSSDYPNENADFFERALDAGGHVADDVAAVFVENELAETLVSDDIALD